MKYSYVLGKKSSRILLGTTYFGDGIGEEESFLLMDRYVAMGGNHLDVARMYADGRSEQIVGRYLKSRGRQEIFLSTKGGAPTAERPLKGRLREEELRQDLEQSLRALGRRDVDFYWLHRDDSSIPAGEIIERMNALVKEGYFPCFGASNWTAERIDEAQRYASDHGLLGFAASQIRFSPAVIRPEEQEKTPDLVGMDPTQYAYYQRTKLPVMAFSAQAKGYFSKLAALGERGLSDKAKARYHSPENEGTLKRILSLAEAHACSVAAIITAAFSAWETPEFFPIVGSRTIEQLTDTLSGGEIDLTAEEAKSVFNQILFE